MPGEMAEIELREYGAAVDDQLLRVLEAGEGQQGVGAQPGGDWRVTLVGRLGDG